MGQISVFEWLSEQASLVIQFVEGSLFTSPLLLPYFGTGSSSSAFKGSTSG